MYLAKQKFQHKPDLDFGRKSFIYLLVNLKNGRKYIGQTSQTVYYLFARYRKESKKYGDNRYITRAIKKYGMENFSFEILEYCDTSSINEREMWHIGNINSKAPNGYNLSDGGETERGWKWTVESKQKLRDSLKNRDYSGQNNPFFGGTHSKETSLKVAESNKRRVGIKRKLLSQKSKDNISDGRMGKGVGERNKKSKTYKIISPSGDLFEFCGGFADFCKEHGIKSRQLLIEVANGLRKDYKGWKCEYKDKNA